MEWQLARQIACECMITRGFEPVGLAGFAPGEVAAHALISCVVPISYLTYINVLVLGSTGPGLSLLPSIYSFGE